MSSSKNAILRTLLYSDIFDYPLKETELFRFLITTKSIDKETFLKALSKKNVNVVFKNNFYCIKGHENIIAERIKREKLSVIKLKIARKIINLISLFPTIRFIGISGALSMGNAAKNDDIDLFIITRENAMWITRLFLIFILKIMGKYRKRGDKNVANKICLNMLLDESNLKLSFDRQNLYCAHEIAQLMPIFSRDGVYKKFIRANNWTTKFLPNLSVGRRGYKKIKEQKRSLNFPISKLLKLLEPLAREVQLYMMKKHITIETVSDNFLALHPFDYKMYTLNAYEERLKKYKT